MKRKANTTKATCFDTKNKINDRVGDLIKSENALNYFNNPKTTKPDPYNTERDKSDSAKYLKYFNDTQANS